MDASDKTRRALQGAAEGLTAMGAAQAPAVQVFLRMAVETPVTTAAQAMDVIHRAVTRGGGGGDTQDRYTFTIQGLEYTVMVNSALEL